MSLWGDDLDSLWTQEEQAYWLAFDSLSGSGLGVARVRLLYERMFTLKAAWHASRSELLSLPEAKPINAEVVDNFLQKRKTIDPFALLASLERTGIHAFPLYHPLYPARLREIHDPPLILYVNGNLHPDYMRTTIAIVGTRRPSSYGQRYAKEIASHLARAGATIISGMAVGVDSLAHWGAIDGGGRTVAVLGCGADVCYPAGNRPLFKRLSEGDDGAVVSEFFPGTKPEPWRFPARNRIISGLSQAVLVVEAGQTSGSLITAKLAFEQSREVFALPGRIDNAMSAGTHKLIKENVAHIFISPEALLKELGWASVPAADKAIPVVVELYGKEKDIHELISNEPIHFDHLIERSGMAAGELSATLTMLELAGVVERLTGDWYTRH
jgi:DNA processing protein